MDAIKYFRGEHNFLSNFYVVPVGYEDLTYPSSEHAFQAAKSTSKSVRETFCNPVMTPGIAKRMGRVISIRSDWDQVKDQIMLDIVRNKFKNPRLRCMLSRTGTSYLFEGNNWHDIYWGVCDGRHTRLPEHTEPIGQNKLGKILERVRFEIWLGKELGI